MRAVPRPRLGLLARFALLSLAVFAVLGVALASLLTRSVEGQGLQDAERLATTLADTLIVPEFRPEDFAAGSLPPERAAQLNERIAAGMSRGGIRHVTVFDRAGRAVWADRPARIGDVEHRNGNLLMARALAGLAASEVEPGHGNGVVETYVPVRWGTGEPVAALELYLPLEPLSRQVRGETRELVAIVLAGLVLTWLALLPLLLGTSRQLRGALARNEQLARVDPLTGLANRLVLEEELRRVAAEPGTYAALLLLDIDRFKEVNDTFGHKAGDALLRLVARQLSAVAQPEDLVVRLGGDEFAVLVGARERPERVASRVRRALSELSIVVNGNPVGTTVSLGLARVADAPDPDTLLQQADIAMYAAKRQGRGLVVFEPDLSEDNSERLALLTELREGIRRSQLCLHVQPAVHLGTGRVSGVEALVRWQHPRLGLLGPDRFVPVAEQTDLIREITWWVLDRAVGACAGWVREGADLCIAVNLSSRDLTPALPGLVSSTLARHGLDPSRLSLELTETSLPQSMRVAREVLQEVVDLGVNLAVDDFGTGFATLAWLRQLPFNALKIDRSFVRDVAVEHGAQELVRHVTALAHGLGQVVVAEGVESRAQQEVLERLGCDYAQGFGLATPMPLEDLPAWVRDRAPAVLARP